MKDYERLLTHRVPPVKAQRAALAFRCEGDPGQTVMVMRQPHFLFRAEELFATDTSERPGRATTIERVFVGNKTQPIVEVPTWMFSEYMTDEELSEARQARDIIGTTLETEWARKLAAQLRFIEAVKSLRFDICNPCLQITFEVTFSRTLARRCAWEAVLWGSGIL